MRKVLKVICITLLVLGLSGCCGFLFYRNMQLNSSYETALTQVTQLQAKLDAVGTFTDIYTVAAPVKSGQEIKEEDLVLQTVPTSSVPSNVINSVEDVKGAYYRISFEPGMPLTQDLVVKEVFEGAVYDRDVFLDSLPVGTQVGDYIDVRVVLPGGEEFVAFEHRRVNARYENAVKMHFDEADLWIYTSMMVDRALYKGVGFKIYCTKYVDPGQHDKVKAYYPVRKEVTDIANLRVNLTENQLKRMYNEDLRKSIDTKLKYYNSEAMDSIASAIASANDEEANRFGEATQYYESILEELAESGTTTDKNGNGAVNTDTGLVDPTKGDTASQNKVEESVGNLESGNSSTDAPTADGQKDAVGNGNVVSQQDILDSQGSNLFDDEIPIT